MWRESRASSTRCLSCTTPLPGWMPRIPWHRHARNRGSCSRIGRQGTRHPSDGESGVRPRVKCSHRVQSQWRFRLVYLGLQPAAIMHHSSGSSRSLLDVRTCALSAIAMAAPLRALTLAKEHSDRHAAEEPTIPMPPPTSPARVKVIRVLCACTVDWDDAATPPPSLIAVV